MVNGKNVVAAELRCAFMYYKHDKLCCVQIGCNTAARGLTDIYARSGECRYISKTPNMSVLQRLCNIFNSRVVLYCIIRN